ncbi:formate hydrogenlyase regulator HycA [Pantoea sp. At-9b]|uniref:formate hydrogenlyase regulator HycA n=1 Tax=Pantoea sp. (strain At-9b) TaxID=592316 RepID=UPI0002DFB28E|nr:formate hydrogenlyase regulator HycA [Pantoea sp. At-9b]
MDIRELSEKATYIAEQQQRLQAQWKQYGNALVQGITLAKARLHHTIDCTPGEGLRFFLFEHFVIGIQPGAGFNNHRIEYYLELADGSDKLLIGSANMDNDGRIDNAFSNRDREQVLTHYLALIQPIYDSLYLAVHENTPVSMERLQQAAVA